jgi:hypothetical protein
MKNTINQSAMYLFKRIRFIMNHTLPYLHATNTLSNEEKNKRINSMNGLLFQLQDEYKFALNSSFHPQSTKITRVQL